MVTRRWDTTVRISPRRLLFRYEGVAWKTGQAMVHQAFSCGHHHVIRHRAAHCGARLMSRLAAAEERASAS